MPRSTSRRGRAIVDTIFECVPQGEFFRSSLAGTVEITEAQATCLNDSLASTTTIATRSSPGSSVRSRPTGDPPYVDELTKCVPLDQLTPADDRLTSRADAAVTGAARDALGSLCAMTVHERPFGRYFEDFELGDVYKHWPGKTITEYDDHLFCMITMNHHPLHTDAWYAETQTQFGKNVVVGNLVYSLVLGMSVPDVSGVAIANLEVESLQHKLPTFHGDTIYAETKVLDKKESQSKTDRGVVTVETSWLQPARRGGLLLPPEGDGAEARGRDSLVNARTSRPSRRNPLEDPRVRTDRWLPCGRSRSRSCHVERPSASQRPAAQSARGRSTSAPPSAYGWKKFTEYPGPLILIVLIIAVVNLIGFGLRFATDSFFVGLVLVILFYIVGQILTIGIINASLMVTRGETPDLGKAFSTDHLGPFIVGSILYGIIVGIGLILCIIPGIIAAIMLAFYGFYILDQGMSADGRHQRELQHGEGQLRARVPGAARRVPHQRGRRADLRYRAPRDRADLLDHRGVHVPEGEQPADRAVAVVALASPDESCALLFRRRRRRAGGDGARRTRRSSAFLDRRPVFKGHVLVIPRAHVVSLRGSARVARPTAVRRGARAARWRCPSRSARRAPG